MKSENLECIFGKETHFWKRNAGQSHGKSNTLIYLSYVNRNLFNNFLLVSFVGEHSDPSSYEQVRS